MAILLLAHGDPAAKNALRDAIEARYGLRPPGIRTLYAQWRGRGRVAVGPVTAWVAAECSAYYHFPHGFRYDFRAKPFGLPVQTTSETDNGQICRRNTAGKTALIEHLPSVRSLRARMWAWAALFLTPLGDQHVRLGFNPDGSLCATHTVIGETACIVLRPDSTIETVIATAYNPDTDHDEAYLLRPSAELVEINELIVPARVQVEWGGAPRLDVEPVSVNYNIDIPTARFRDSEQVTV